MSDLQKVFCANLFFEFDDFAYDQADCHERRRFERLRARRLEPVYVGGIFEVARFELTFLQEASDALVVYDLNATRFYGAARTERGKRLGQDFKPVGGLVGEVYNIPYEGIHRRSTATALQQHKHLYGCALSFFALFFRNAPRNALQGAMARYIGAQLTQSVLRERNAGLLPLAPLHCIQKTDGVLAARIQSYGEFFYRRGYEEQYEHESTFSVDEVRHFEENFGSRLTCAVEEALAALTAFPNKLAAAADLLPPSLGDVNECLLFVERDTYEKLFNAMREWQRDVRLLGYMFCAGVIDEDDMSAVDEDAKARIAFTLTPPDLMDARAAFDISSTKKRKQSSAKKSE